MPQGLSESFEFCASQSNLLEFFSVEGAAAVLYAYCSNLS